MACRSASCKAFWVPCFGGRPRSRSGAYFRNRCFVGSPPPRPWWDGIFPEHLRWRCDRKGGTWWSTPVSSLPDFFSGGRWFSLGRVSRKGLDGGFFCTFFSRLCRATSFPDFLFFRSGWSIQFIFPNDTRSAFPLLMTRNSRGH